MDESQIDYFGKQLLSRELYKLLNSRPDQDISDVWDQLGPLKINSDLLRVLRDETRSLEFGSMTGKEGQMTYEYTGQLLKGKPAGIGRCFFHAVESLFNTNLRFPEHLYEGQFENGQRSGYGRWISSNNSYYIGMWKAGEYDGHGKEVKFYEWHKLPKILQGQFEEGEYVEDTTI